MKKSYFIPMVLLGLFSFFTHKLEGQELRKKVTHGFNAGLTYSAIGFLDERDVKCGSVLLGYQALININRDWAFETGISYRALYMNGLFYDLGRSINGSDFPWESQPLDLELYHFSEIPLLLSKKLGKRGSDRMFFGIVTSLPVLQPEFTDIFKTHFQGVIGYRYQLENNSYFSISTSYGINRSYSLGSPNSFFDGRLIHFHFTYHYFFNR